MAEKAAWDFVAALPEDEKFDLVIINPGLIFGPNLNKCNFSSGDIMKKILLNQLPGMPKVQMPIVDVRDVAMAHLNAIKFENVKNKRYMLVGDCVWFKEIGDMAHEKYGKEYNVCHKELPKALMWFATFFNAEAKATFPMWGLSMNCDNSATRADLAIDFIDCKKSVHDMCEALIDCGYV